MAGYSGINLYAILALLSRIHLQRFTDRKKNYQSNARFFVFVFQCAANSSLSKKFFTLDLCIVGEKL
jgi:hypothetical protein